MWPRPGGRRRVFERFYRHDNGRAGSAGGSGLGLSVVASLMAAHGGSASVTTTEGGGSIFVLLFPLHPDQGSASQG